ncbi:MULTISPECIES: hypothetical protein [Cryobacterium]|nr:MULTISPECIES: hypothetical protein [Cryobacterium]
MHTDVKTTRLRADVRARGRLVQDDHRVVYPHEVIGRLVGPRHPLDRPVF